MKKLLLSSIILLSVSMISAQWVSDPSQNTRLASGDLYYGEILLATHPQNGNTFIQWCGLYDNGWSPSIQKVDSMGNSLWGTNGVHIDGQNFDSYSNGIAMVPLTDGGVVSGFVNYNGECIAVKIDEDGNFAWGSNGIVALDAENCLRTKLVAGHEGNFWILSHNNHSVYLRCYHSDGTPVGNQITISDDSGKSIAFGQMVLDDQDNVFVVYMKQQYNVGSYFNKSIHVTKYSPEGLQLSQEEELMATVSISGEIVHNACSDGMGGGYAWICHAALNDIYEVYMFHFDSEGHNTISEPTGLIVSQTDGMNFHVAKNASLHPTSHDLMVSFLETDASSESHYALIVNRITPNGIKVWGNNGITILPTTDDKLSMPLIDAFPDGSGASIIYKFNDYSIKAIGINDNGATMWNSTVATQSTEFINLAQTASGYHYGQNIIAWEGSRDNIFGLYGQNIKLDGSCGPVSVEDVDNDLISVYQYGDLLHISGVDVKQIQLVNMMGQLVRNGIAGEQILSVGQLPQGIYIVRILTPKGKMVNKKILIK